VLTGGVLLATGDAIEQGIEARRGIQANYDYKRTGTVFNF